VDKPGDALPKGSLPNWIGGPQGGGHFTIPKSLDAEPRKAPGRLKQAARTKTDTGRRDEYSQALERTLVKELGNMTP
jgi:hypothetical protein